MARVIEVQYVTKVYCAVDVEGGEIVSVVEDPNITPTGLYAAQDEGSITAAEEIRASEIAESADWPAWERSA